GGSAYAKLFNPASRYAIVGACAKISASGGVCSAASVAIGGLTPNAKQASSVAAALVGKALNAANIATAAAAVANDLGDDVMGDIHASEEYRRAMAPVYVERALTAAAARAKRLLHITANRLEVGEWRSDLLSGLHSFIILCSEWKPSFCLR
ncbi:MAG: hypothetical protein KDE53_18075, partial [Caldilineaceae bacterium]|nr:hypothetical protein [Caldilineaceae bacterium]